MPMARAIAVILAVFAAPTASWAARDEQPRQDRATLYRCARSIQAFEGEPGFLALEKVFREDGTLYSRSVVLEDSAPRFVRLPQTSASASATLRWPGDHRFQRETEPFSWSRGSIQINYLDGRMDRYRPLRREVWRQIVVDRNGAALIHETGGIRTLFLSGLNIHLVSELAPLSSSGRLHMALDDLIAWGTGAERVTVYEVMVQRRRYVPNVYPNGPAGRMRIVAEYDIDAAALAARVAQVQAAASAWEAGLTNVRETCERSVEELPGDIIVT
jgi:hypothetical protein